MNHSTTGCLICGKPLLYFNYAEKLTCEICGHIFETNASCEDEHYVCDKCHSQPGINFITAYMLKTDYKDPFAIVTDIMKNRLINMHGPEHHYLVCAALLAAFKNANGDINLRESLNTALQRAKNVPGGICGLWGSCGAGISSGIFISVITGASPLSEKEWSLANLMTSQVLNDISQKGGPRCCKRSTYLALSRSVIFVKEQFHIEMEAPNTVSCEFSHNNKQCKKGKCCFYPIKLS